jgi:hypothetical protein
MTSAECRHKVNLVRRVCIRCGCLFVCCPICCPADRTCGEHDLPKAQGRRRHFHEPQSPAPPQFRDGNPEPKVETPVDAVVTR